MKITISIFVLAAAVLLAGCGKKSESTRSAESPPTPASAPVVQPAMSAWQQGDRTNAISHFLAANWDARPLFVSGSALNLSEDQFKSLSDAERMASFKDMNAQLDELKEVAAAVAQAGREAAAQGDSGQARKILTTLKRAGETLDTPDCLALVQLVGQAFIRMAEAELAKLPVKAP